MSGKLSRGVCASAIVVSSATLVYDPLAPAVESKRVALLLVSLVGLGIALARRRSLGLSTAAWASLALVVWSGVSLLWGRPSGLAELALWTAGVGLLLGLCSLFEAQERRQIAGWVALLSGGGAGLWAAVQVLFGYRGLAVQGGQGNANWLGLLIAITIPLTWEVLRASWKDRLVAQRWIALGSVLVQAIGLVLSHSRVAWAAVVVSIVVWVAASRAGWKRTLAAACGAVALLAVVVASQRGVKSTRERAVLAHDVEIATALQGRAWIWGTSARVAEKAFPLGTGLGDFPHQFLVEQGARLANKDVRSASHRFENAVTAHNDWVQSAAELGVVGFLLLVLVWVLALQGCWRQGWSAAIASWTALAVCAWGDSPLRQPGIVVLAFLLLSALPGRVSSSSVRSCGLIASLACSALLLAFAVQTWIASRWVTQARQELPEASLGRLERALRLDPRSGEAAFALGVAWLEVGEAERALESLRLSKSLLANVGTAVAIGNAEVRLSNLAGAEAAYREALSLYPGAFKAQANLAEVLRRQGKTDEAERHLALAKLLWPGNPHLAERKQLPGPQEESSD